MEKKSTCSTFHIATGNEGCSSPSETDPSLLSKFTCKEGKKCV